MISLFLCPATAATMAAGRKVLPQGGATNAGRGRSGFFVCKVKKNTALPSSFTAEMEVKIRKWM
ncbi:hypothetical protein DW812_01275 [Mediterraneibacter gnavus]|uniref:Uncharacterized protein n=1 Tax=Mediterraneibacter gnavus TaxID=33038 RepID=A0A414DFG6_MEDGN|nr:hypothetical protein DW812_01275 [Mediterraneibacter gnavus]